MKASYRFMLLKALMVTVTIIVTAFSQTPSTAWYTGNPDAESFEISTADDLAGLAVLVNGGNDFDGKTVRLVSDIDLSVHYGEGYNGGKGWIPIASFETDEDGNFVTQTPFLGAFDGNGKIVSGLYINDPELDYAGLFGSAGAAEALKNLGVVGASVSGRYKVGGLAGAFGTNPMSSDFNGITGCYVTGTISGVRATGGVVGVLGFGEVKNSYFSGTVDASEAEAGGVVGDLRYGIVTNCYSVGTVSGEGSVGGVVGSVEYASVTNCYSTCAVSGVAWGVGGVVGTVGSYSSVNNSAALNPKVITVNNISGRVSGNVTGGSDSYDNVGYFGMISGDGSIEWGNKGANTNNGVDIDISEIQSDGTIGGRFTAEGGWVTADGFLPGFGAPVEIPAHLKRVHASKPTIVTQPGSEVTQSPDTVETTISIAVEASASDGGTLSYQWYFSATGRSNDGTPIDGAIDASYPAPIDEDRVGSYFVIVTNTIEDNGDGGVKTASTVSSRAEVVKDFPYAISVSSKDRIIPDAPPRTEVAAIAPISVSSSKFTVGPNPVAKSGAVNFFYSGSRINSGALAIYDASGNFVKKLKISGKPASGNSAARGVASWDLTDKKSRPVPSGTYLVKGVLSASNGKRERVSVVVLVR